MTKSAEIRYLEKLGPDGTAHALRKPFSDPACGEYLMRIGAIASLLPTPPAKLLDLGCGTGWTSRFFAEMGFRVTGQDIATDMIREAIATHSGSSLDLVFEASDYEHPRYRSEFDVVVFFDSLHHAENELTALRSAFDALVPGGICVTSEPGLGHAQSPEALAAVDRFGVNERDMPPSLIRSAGKEAGFTAFRTYAHPSSMARVFFRPSHESRPIWKRALGWDLLRAVGAPYLIAREKRRGAIVVLSKPSDRVLV